MIPLKLTLHNFMSYKNPTPLDFSSFDLACLCGENGSGKSTILEAITFALWGKARSSPDALIHRNQQGMWVDFEFQQDKKKYRVIRKRSKKGKGLSELDFLVYNNGWESLAGATIKETEEKISDVIKLPYEIFINSAYLRQGHADEFTTKLPSQRKEILGKILGLDFYELLSQKAKEKVRASEIEEEALTTSILEIKENLKQKEIFEKEFKESEKNLKTKEKELKEEQEKLEGLRKYKSQFDLKSQSLENKSEQLVNIAEEGKQLKMEIVHIAQEIKEIENLLKHREEIEKGYKKLNEFVKENEIYNEKLVALSKYQEKFGAAKAKKEEVNLKIERLKKIAVCPTCLRPLSRAEAEKIIKNLKTDFEKTIAITLKELQSKIQEIGYNKERHQKIKQEINQYSHFEEEKRKLDLASRTLEEKRKSVQKTTNKLNEKKQIYLKVLEEKRKLEKEVLKLKPIEEKYLTQENIVNRLQEQLLEIKGQYGAFSQRLEDLKRQEQLLNEKKKKLEEIQKQSGVYKELSEIFSKRGLQAMIIETVLPEIEEEANKILEKITDGRMRVSFLTSKEKKSGEGEIETLDIKVTDAFGERDYALYSGGEAFRIDLAIRVALSKVLSKRAGTKLQFLAIDEGFGSLDQAGKDEVIEAIQALKGDFEKILIVTHIQEFKNLFPTRIEVYKDDEGSHLEVVSV